MAQAIPYLFAGGTALSVVGDIYSANTARKAANFNAGIADQNATIARQAAELDATQIDRERRLALGTMVASQGASGGVMTGSVLDIISDTSAQYALQKSNTLYQGELKARGYKLSAKQYRRQGRQAQISGYLSAAGDLLGGGANTYTSFKRLG